MNTLDIAAILTRNAELLAGLHREMALTQAAFALTPRTVAPVEVAPADWQDARDTAERDHGSRLAKFYRS